MESLCGLELGCYVQKVPTPRKGSHKYWQIACHVPWLFSLLTRTNSLQIPHHLSPDGSVLDPRSFTLIHLLSFLLSKISSSAGLGFDFVPLPRHAPCRMQPTAPPPCPGALSNLALRSSSHFQAGSPSPSIAVGAAEFMKFEEAQRTATRLKSSWLVGAPPKDALGTQVLRPAGSPSWGVSPGTALPGSELRRVRQPAPPSSQTQAFHIAPAPSPHSSI